MKRYNRGKRTDAYSAGFGIAFMVAWVASIYGYIANIVKLINVAFGGANESTLVIVLRIVGTIVAPLGAILGFF